MALGSLVLANNDLTWSELAKIKHLHVLQLTLLGNPRLERDPFCKFIVYEICEMSTYLHGIVKVIYSFSWLTLLVHLRSAPLVIQNLLTTVNFYYFLAYTTIDLF